MFSETRIGLCAHTVANYLSPLVAQTTTKSDTNFLVYSSMGMHSFGNWLRRRRKALDLTQDGLADRVGCSVAMIRKIESGEAAFTEAVERGRAMTREQAIEYALESSINS